MKTILNFKVIVLMAMVSLFALNVSAQNADEAKVLFSVKLDCKSCVKKVENHFGPMRGVKKVVCSIPDQTVEIVYSTKRLDEAKLIAEFKKRELEAKPIWKSTGTEVKTSCVGHKTCIIFVKNRLLSFAGSSLFLFS